MRALTSKFLVQPPNAECGDLETAHKDSRQMFQHFDRTFEQILYKFNSRPLLACEDFKRRFQDDR